MTRDDIYFMRAIMYVSDGSLRNGYTYHGIESLIAAGWFRYRAPRLFFNREDVRELSPVARLYLRGYV